MYVLNQQNWPYAVKKQNPGGGKKIHLKKVLTAFIKEKTVFLLCARARVDAGFPNRKFPGLSRHHHSVEVLADPPETVAVALALKDRAHEQFERAAVQLRPRDLALARRLPVQPERLP
jgi:hypothetical protein